MHDVAILQGVAPFFEDGIGDAAEPGSEDDTDGGAQSSIGGTEAIAHVRRGCLDVSVAEDGTAERHAGSYNTMAAMAAV
jgi:hypothetical protein